MFDTIEQHFDLIPPDPGVRFPGGFAPGCVALPGYTEIHLQNVSIRYYYYSKITRNVQLFKFPYVLPAGGGYGSGQLIVYTYTTRTGAFYAAVVANYELDSFARTTGGETSLIFADTFGSVPHLRGWLRRIEQRTFENGETETPAFFAGLLKEHRVESLYV